LHFRARFVSGFFLVRESQQKKNINNENQATNHSRHWIFPERKENIGLGGLGEGDEEGTGISVFTP
jgi:hypothetical protein